MLRIGLDAGGTSTRATVVTADGSCVGFASGAGGNPVSSGKERASQAIRATIDAALAQADATLGDVESIASAMAGGSAGLSRDWLLSPLGSRGFSGTMTWESDLLATYFSGVFSPFGYAIVSGTGAAVVCVDEGRIAATADGLGWLLGDSGSGFWIGHQVARAVMADIDTRGPATALTPRLLDALSVSTAGPAVEGRPAALPRLITALYEMRPVQLAQFAPLAFGEPDDEVSRGILETAGAHLANSVGSVHKRSGPLVIGGSVLAQSGRLAESFAARLAERGIDPVITRVADGVVGSALLALRASGATITGDLFARVTTSVAEVRGLP